MSEIVCYLNNLGIVNALGANTSEVATNLLNNNSNKLVTYNQLFSGRKTYIGKVTSILQNIPTRLAKFNCVNNKFLATAYASIKNDVELLKYKYGSHRIGIILGTSTSGIASSEAALKQYACSNNLPPEFNYAQQETGSCSEFLAQYAGITGINYTVSTACSSSGKAFAVAARLIKSGCCDAVIVGGSDSLCELTLNGFDSLELLSPDICNPFSKNRKGLNIGEGAALFILSKEPSSIKLIGVGEASDGYHMTAPDPQGIGAKLAILQSLKTANIKPDDIGYISLHGTGSRKNDAMEALAINELFANAPYCSSVKPLIGHTLGAAGAHELALCWLLLSEKYNPDHMLPPHIWDREQDQELPHINLISDWVSWKRSVFLSVSFAFGGSNVCLIIARQCDTI